MKTVLSLVMISSLMLSTTAVQAQSVVHYNCDEAYEKIFAKTLEKNITECDQCSPSINTAGIVTASVAGAGYYSAVLASMAIAAAVSGLFGVVMVGYGGYYAGKQVSHTVRYLKGNPYHQANLAITLSLLQEEFVTTKKILL